MRPAVIFDLDGTLTDPSRRRHLLHGDDRNFAAFEHEAGNDPVVEPIKRLLLILRETNAIVLTTGRTERFRPLTGMWLALQEIPSDVLMMRANRDGRPDHVVKREMLDRIRAEGLDPWLVVDDRNSVVKMWREAGLTCLQCNEGDF